MWPDMAHHDAARKIALAGVTIVRDEAGLIPLKPQDFANLDLGVIEFASGTISPVETARNEPFGGSTLATLLGQRHPEVRFLTLHSGAQGAAEMVDAFLTDHDLIVVSTPRPVVAPPPPALLAGIGEARH